MNNLRFAMPMLGCLKYNTSPETEWMVIDNGSIDPIERYIRDYIKPKRLNFIRFEENQGLTKTNQLAYEKCETELLCLLHSDCFIFEKDWDQRIISYFKDLPEKFGSPIGIAGFFGSQGCLANGGRLQDVERPGQMAGLSNMLEAEIHGIRMKQPWRSCGIYDSFAMVLSMDMLRAAGGFDLRYKFHHYYDRDVSLESLRRGFNNIVVNVPNHHIGGLTHEHVEYEKWLKSKIGKIHEDGVLHNKNKGQFMEKWKDVLPLYIEDDFSFREGVISQVPDQTYKGDAIRRMK